jgi:hypothetical protein
MNLAATAVVQEGRCSMGVITVEESSRDELSRLAGCFLYSGTQVWIENGVLHREDGPAVVSPDGAVRWFIGGKEMTRAVNTFFYEKKWPLEKGLDTTEKLEQFKDKFLI